MKIPRVVYAALGFAAAAAAIGLVVWQRASWWPLAVFAIAPDISLLIGASSGLQRGQLHPRAVPIYNAVHRFWVPAALAIVSALLQQPAWVAAGLAWIAHIGFDRSLGFGLRTPEGFQRS
ncbi:MAG TPA: DUF4260 family protein [Candidatus Dormibacteraeota bacterium]|nr:DUF4260 family protein [Candidatus Dormibacteraeota bacterium]